MNLIAWLYIGIIRFMLHRLEGLRIGGLHLTNAGSS
jgi:hypothetical protein